MKTYRLVAIIASFVLSIIIAIGVGAGLALWDQEITLSDLAGYYAENNKDIVTDTQKITGLSKDKLSDYTQTSLLPELNSGNTIEPAVSIPEPLMAASETEEEEPLFEEHPIDFDEEETEDGDELVKVSAEISCIPIITKAGSEETLVNNASGPEQNVVEGEYRDPVATYPLEMKEVSLDYFDDALFIGDSRVAGLGMYSGTNATFYAATAFQLFEYKSFKVVPTANGKVPIFDVMPFDKFTKVYIKVGLNELGCVSEENFISVYQELITQIRLMQPRAIIYLHAVLPVTAAKSASNNTHTNPKIASRNESIKALAAANNCYYIDASEPFVDETGALKAETTADGVHMYPKYMPEWIEYLRKHAVPWP